MTRPGKVQVALAGAAVACVATLTAFAPGREASPITVAPGDPVEAAVANAGHRPILLEAGVHPAFTVEHPVTIRGAPGAVVDGEILVRADAVRLEDLDIVGGYNGVTVRDADHVVLADLTVRGAEYHGIEVVQGSALIRDCFIAGLTTRYGQGIEVRNSNGHPRSRIEHCEVRGGQEGIVSHVSRVEIRDNVVWGQTMRGIAVTEMSDGLVERNHVSGVTGVAIFCGDMSRCEIQRNHVTDITADPAGIRSRGGQAVVTWFYSTVRHRDNTFAVDAVPAVDVYRGSGEVDRFPLSHWPAGWRGALPGLGVSAIAVGAALAVRLAVWPLARRLRGRHATRTPGSARRARLGRDVLISIGVVQLFHVVEHVVQVFQIYVAHAEHRHGLAGARFDTEWLHLGFNAVVFAGVAVGTVLVWPALRGRHSPVLTWLVAALVVQSWHVAEHVVRIFQYLGTGVSPAPGIIGAELGLVWFHYGINITVVAALTMAAFHAVRHRATLERPARSRSAGSPHSAESRSPEAHSERSELSPVPA